MNDDNLFRWIFIVIFVLTLFVSAYFRRKARQSGDVIDRAQEGSAFMIMRALFAAPLYLSMFAFMINPRWMAWSTLSLPAGLRWAGVLVGLGNIALLYWVMSSIGENVSETYLTKEEHTLVTHGPYRWVRHPLYLVATIGFVALGFVSANWFILAIALLSIVAISLLVIPKEEAALIAKFGDAYREYRKRTGMLLPHLGGRSEDVQG